MGYGSKEFNKLSGVRFSDIVKDRLDLVATSVPDLILYRMWLLPGLSVTLEFADGFDFIFMSWREFLCD